MTPLDGRRWQRRWRRLTAFGDRQRSEFLANLAGLVDSGIPVYDALQEMAKVLRREKDPRAAILVAMVRRLDAGQSLAEAMRPWLAAHEAMMVDASGRGVLLNAALRHAADLTAARTRIVGAVTGALGYPAVLLAVGAAMLWVFGTQVIPILTQILTADRWTGLGAFYHGLSSLIVHHGGLILLLGLTALGAALASLPRWKPGRLRGWLDRRVPPWNLYQVYQGAILLISIATMMRSGIAMSDAADILQENARAPWLKAHLRTLRRRLEEGGGVRLAALNHPIFPPDIRIAVALFDKFSEPDQAMAKLGVQAGDSAEKSAKRIGLAANAAVLVGMGLLLAGFVGAVFSVVMQFYTDMLTHMKL
jgi:type II secretory pathway component PulF